MRRHRKKTIKRKERTDSPAKNVAGVSIGSCAGEHWCEQFRNELDCWFLGGAQSSDCLDYYTDTYGQDLRDEYGCGVGCKPCRDLPLYMLMYWVHERGQRFLMNYQPYDVDQPVMQNRDAHGMLHDLRSDEPRLIPRVTHYHLAPVWNNFGTECIEDECAILPEVQHYTDDPEGCVDGTAVGDPISGYLGDCFLSKGYKRADANTSLFCKHTLERYFPRRVTMSGEYLFQTAFARTHRGEACYNSFMTLCVGHVHPGDCEAAYGRFPLEGSEGCSEGVICRPSIYYNANDASRQAFNILQISGNPRFERTEHNEIYQSEGLTALRNAVLYDVMNQTFPGWSVAQDGSPINANPVNFDQLDKDFESVERYHRGWNTSNDPSERAPCDVLPAVNFPITGRLYHSNISFPAQVVIQQVFFDASVVPHAIERPSYGPFVVQPVIEQHLRGRIRVRLGVRVSFPSDAALVKTWLSEDDPDRTTPLSIPNADCYAEPMPKVFPNIDRIQYRSAYGSIDIPQWVEWWGALNSFTVPKSRDWTYFYPASYPPPPTTVDIRCEYVRDCLQDVPIVGWPVAVDTHPNKPHQIWGGQVRIRYER